MRRTRKSTKAKVDADLQWELSPKVQRRLRISSKELKSGQSLSLKDFISRVKATHHAGAFPLTITRKALRRLRHQT